MHVPPTISSIKSPLGALDFNDDDDEAMPLPNSKKKKKKKRKRKKQKKTGSGLGDTQYRLNPMALQIYLVCP
jgi:hypothetical protein